MNSQAQREIQQLLRRDGIVLVPFAISIIVYILSSMLGNSSQLHSTLIKCAPTLSLIIFVFGSESKRKPNKWHLTFGLVLSAIGDALLNIDLFVFGIIAFAIAHVSYIIGFGWKPVRLSIAIYLAIPAVCVLWIILPHVTDPAVAIGLPVYTAVLSMMSWRAIARVNGNKKLKQSQNILKTATAIGSVLFVLSDTFIAIDRFYVAIPCRTLLIMGTYYAAQFTIALAVYQ